MGRGNDRLRSPRAPQRVGSGEIFSVLEAAQKAFRTGKTESGDESEHSAVNSDGLEPRHHSSASGEQRSPTGGLRGTGSAMRIENASEATSSFARLVPGRGT